MTDRAAERARPGKDLSVAADDDAVDPDPLGREQQCCRDVTHDYRARLWIAGRGGAI